MADPLVTAAAIEAGGSFLGGLFDGEGRRGKRLDNDLKGQEFNRRDIASRRGALLFELGQKMFGKDIFDPRQAIGQFQQATAGTREKNAQRINKRLDLDSGTAQGELNRLNQPLLAQFLLQGLRQNAFGKSNRDTTLLGSLSSNFGR